MAKIVKDTRVTMDVDTELENIKKNKKAKEETKEIKKDDKKKKDNKKNNKKDKVKKTNNSFFKEVKNEMSKVKWPSKKDMVKYSIATIVFIVFFALFFYLIDIIIALLMKAGA